MLYNQIDPSTSFGETCLIYPKSKQLSQTIPKDLQKTYKEASRISKISPNAFATQIRKALEYLCKYKNVRGTDLKSMLKNLAVQKIIPPILAEMTDNIRLFGNYGAHANKIDITYEDVELIDDFFMAIL